MWNYNLSEMAREEEPPLGPVPKTAFEKIEEGLKEALEIARGHAPPAEERPYLPIHRAMSQMLHADERYTNRTFMPNGQFTADRGTTCE
jgi:hypothetical protein